MIYKIMSIFIVILAITSTSISIPQQAHAQLEDIGYFKGSTFKVATLSCCSDAA